MTSKINLKLSAIFLAVTLVGIGIGGCKKAAPPPTPTLQIYDQDVDVQDADILITRVAIDKMGFLVINPSGPDGKIDTTKNLAITRLGGFGTMDNLQVKIVGDNIGVAKLFGSLYYDSPQDSNFTPGDSTDPIVTAGGAPVQVSFTATGKPANITASNQQVSNGIIKINQVVTDRTAWVILRSSEGSVIGESLFPIKGVYNDALVPVEFAGNTVNVTATLHEESPADGKYTGDTNPSQDVLIPGVTVTFTIIK